MKEVIKIVITGGPCGGKTTAMSWIQNTFKSLGYTVLFINEVATELILSGIAPWTCHNNFEFQKLLFQTQLNKEKVFDEAIKKMPGEKFLIVCDRGLLDGKAFMSIAEFQAILAEFKVNEVQIRDSYDAVFHLTTAAKSTDGIYTLENNAARSETPEEAIEKDDRLISAWTGHPHLRVIDNQDDFEQKMKSLMKEISIITNEPVHYEIERKFLIKMPDINRLCYNPNCQKVNIIQTYLQSDEPGKEMRVRQRGDNEDFLYYLTTKQQISEAKRIETEKRISEKEYLKYLMKADVSLRPVRKTRYCLSENGQYFEIDVYPFAKETAILEVELPDANADIKFPKDIEIIKEVTNDIRYNNASIAKIFPEDMI